MANFNKVILAGNLTRDPQLSFLPNNNPVCEFGMAINRKWKGQDGQMRDDVCFVDLQAYGKSAELINQYMAKGRGLLIEGRLKFDQWEGKDGEKRSKMRVVVESFQFLGGPPDGSRGAARPAGRTAEPARGGGVDEMPPVEEVAPAGEDIPF